MPTVLQRGAVASGWCGRRRFTILVRLTRPRADGTSRDPAPPPGRGQQARGREMERIEVDLLVPGNGEPIGDGVVVWDGPTIAYAGPAADAPPAPPAPRPGAAPVLPGFWDSHGHLLGPRSRALGRLPLEPLALRAARCAADLQAALDA